MDKFFCCICLLFGLVFADETMQMEYQYLDQLAIELGADKSSSIHNYTKTYAQFLSPIRTQPIKFLEIGICGGASVRLWDRYFPNAELHFIDIAPDVLKLGKPSRANYHILDQADPIMLNEFLGNVGGNFDVIIDDGGHHMHQQLISFQTLFPHLQSGGLYIIEDLHTSYWTWFGGGGTLTNPSAGPGTMIEFLKNLVEDLNYTSGFTGYGDWKRMPKDIWINLNEYQKHIESIHFYKSLCIIRKI